MSKLAERPELPILLKCGHRQLSRAGVRSTTGSCLQCGTAGRTYVTLGLLTEAQRYAAGERPGRPQGRPRQAPPKPRQAAAPPGPAPGTPPGTWQPQTLEAAVFTRDPGTCKCGQPRTWPRTSRGTMTLCTSCGTWSLPPNVLHSHSAAAGAQQARSQDQKDDDQIGFYQRMGDILRQARPYLADPDIPEAAKDELVWILDKLNLMRRTRTLNDDALTRLEDRLERLDLGFEETTWTEDDEGEVVEGEIVEDGEAPPVTQPPARPQLPRARGPLDFTAWTKPRQPEPVTGQPAVAWLPVQPPSRPAVSGGVRPRIARERGLPAHDQVVAATLAVSLAVHDASRAAAAAGRALTGAEGMQAAGLYRHVPPVGATVRRPRSFTLRGRRSSPALPAATGPEPAWQARWDAAATAAARRQR